MLSSVALNLSADSPPQLRFPALDPSQKKFNSRPVVPTRLPAFFSTEKLMHSLFKTETTKASSVVFPAFLSYAAPPSWLS